MKLTKQEIQQEFERIWPQVKKNLSKINKDIIKIAQESEKNLIHISKKVKKNTERMIIKAKREELYYELGKSIAPLLTSDQLKNKKINSINVAIRKLSRKLGSRKR